MAVTLQLPLAVDATGALATLTQDSPADVAQSVDVLLSTTIGERAALPDYGISNPLGQALVDEAEIAQAIAEWEDRVDDVVIDQVAAVLADGTTTDVVTVTLTAIGGS